MYRGADASREVGRGWYRKVDYAAHKPASWHFKLRQDDEILVRHLKVFGTVVSLHTKLVEQALGTKHHDTGVGPLWSTENLSPLWTSMLRSSSVNFSIS